MRHVYIQEDETMISLNQSCRSPTYPLQELCKLSSINSKQTTLSHHAMPRHQHKLLTPWSSYLDLNTSRTTASWHLRRNNGKFHLGRSFNWYGQFHIAVIPRFIHFVCTIFFTRTTRNDNGSPQFSPTVK